jgi:hypothetical protein
MTAYVVTTSVGVGKAKVMKMSVRFSIQSPVHGKLIWCFPNSYGWLGVDNAGRLFTDSLWIASFNSRQNKNDNHCHVEALV